MRRFAPIALALSAAALLSGCASLITGGELIRPGEPTGGIAVHNQTRQPLGVVLISACSASSYGLNRLPQGVSIPQGRSYTFEVSAGCWDVDAGAIGVGEARQRLSVSAGRITRYTVTQ
jgi:hypothetical protein